MRYQRASIFTWIFRLFIFGFLAYTVFRLYNAKYSPEWWKTTILMTVCCGFVLGVILARHAQRRINREENTVGLSFLALPWGWQAIASWLALTIGSIALACTECNIYCSDPYAAYALIFPFLTM